MKKELVIVLDFGGQYNQLVARRVRECNVYCEIYSYKTDLEKIKAMNPKGIILTGGGALIEGFTQILKQNLDVPVFISDNPLTNVAEGVGIMLDNLYLLEN